MCAPHIARPPLGYGKGRLPFLNTKHNIWRPYSKNTKANTKVGTLCRPVW